MEEKSSTVGTETTIRRLWGAVRARPELVWLGAIVTLAGVAYFATLGLQSFDSGETITATRIIHPSYADTFTAFSTIERSGPLYYTLAWGWSHLFGLGEVALRSLSAIFGLATIVVAFLIGRELFRRRVHIRSSSSSRRRRCTSSSGRSGVQAAVPSPAGRSPRPWRCPPTISRPSRSRPRRCGYWPSTGARQRRH